MPPSKPRDMTSHNGLHALLFQATSAEYVALCQQTYQLARHALLERLKHGMFRSAAVVFDLDETVFDNSAYQAWQIQAGTNFDEATSWRAWCLAAQAEAVPGAVDFIRFVGEHGCTPIFITSREDVTRQATLHNLAGLRVITSKQMDDEVALIGQADAAASTMLFMKRMSDVKVDHPSGNRTIPLGNKFLQRVFLEQERGFEIALSVGDNLADYAEYYGRVMDARGDEIRGSHPMPESRMSSVLQDVRLVGRDFILIPNVTYGGWLRAFEGNLLGAADELARTGDPVRGPLAEPQDEFSYPSPTQPPGGPLAAVKPLGPKFREGRLLRIWHR